MSYVISCGGVVFTRKAKEILYVIVQHNGGHCGFPKGLMEPGEDEQTTALREIQEEVGLTASLFDDFRAEEVYELPGTPGVTKKVIYFLAEFAGQQIQHQVEELSTAFLLPYEEALQTLTFTEAKNILMDANHFLVHLDSTPKASPWGEAVTGGD